MAQAVEHLPCKQKALSSNPILKKNMEVKKFSEKECVFNFVSNKLEDFQKEPRADKL
jgi:23S rRNA A1618 N6-methylase RlmF